MIEDSPSNDAGKHARPSKRSLKAIGGIAVVAVSGAVISYVAYGFHQVDKSFDFVDDLEKEYENLEAGPIKSDRIHQTNSIQIPVNERPSSEADLGPRLDVIVPFLEDKRAQSVIEINSELSRNGRLTLENPADFSDPNVVLATEISNEITADLWTASSQQDAVFGKELIAGIFEPGTAAYSITVDEIGNGLGRILSPTYVDSASPIFTEGTLGAGVEVNGAPTIVMRKVDHNNGRIFQQVVSIFKSQDGKSQKYIVRETQQSGGSGFLTGDLSALSPSR